VSGQVEEQFACRKCGTVHPNSHYPIDKRTGRKVYRRRICNRCKGAGQAARRKVIRAWVDGYKAAGACKRCGFSDPRALDFHHRDDTTKIFNVGDAVRIGYGLAEIQSEVAKCDLVCANCHRIEHHERREPTPTPRRPFFR
jgi:hypothetical protein